MVLVQMKIWSSSPPFLPKYISLFTSQPPHLPSFLDAPTSSAKLHLTASTCRTLPSM